MSFYPVAQTKHSENQTEPAKANKHSMEFKRFVQLFALTMPELFFFFCFPVQQTHPPSPSRKIAFLYSSLRNGA